jgi:predicted acetyltransferase
LNAKGVALSTLYPATVSLYRKAGYEHAGARFEIMLMLGQLVMADRKHEIRRMTPDDRSIAEAIYSDIAPSRNGYLDRNEMMWKRVTAPRGQTTQGFVAHDPHTGVAEGYVYYMQQSSDDAPYMLTCTDLVWKTAAAGRRLLTFLQDHGTMADKVVLHGGSTDPTLGLLPERIHRVRLLDHWMLRIVDVGAALASRGYPIGLKGEIHLDVVDDVLVANNGRYVLEIDSGRGQVSTGGQGHLKIDIRGLAAMYTGFRTPAALMLMGLLSADDDANSLRSLQLAATAFAGGESCMSDAF